MARHGVDSDAVERLKARRRDAARRGYGVADPEPTTPDPMVAWPLSRSDLPRGCDVATALILSPHAADDQTAAWIHGLGWVTERYSLAERDLTRFEALEAAVAMALGEGRSAAELDVVELQEISSVASFAACESIGLAEPGHGATAALAVSPAVNPSGGNLYANPGNAAGFLRLVAAIQQIRGRAGDVQVEPAPRSALGAAMHGFAGQGAVAVLFGAGEEEWA
jgi:acetyl-CoA C-acetyltransferase